MQPAQKLKWQRGQIKVTHPAPKGTSHYSKSAYDLNTNPALPQDFKEAKVAKNCSLVLVSTFSRQNDQGFTQNTLHLRTEMNLAHYHETRIQIGHF